MKVNLNAFYLVMESDRCFGFFSMSRCLYKEVHQHSTVWARICMFNLFNSNNYLLKTGLRTYSQYTCYTISDILKIKINLMTWEVHLILCFGHLFNPDFLLFVNVYPLTVGHYLQFQLVLRPSWKLYNFTSDFPCHFHVIGDNFFILS